MIFSDEVILQELMWEYDYTQEQAQSILSSYKSQDKLSELYELIQHKLDLKNLDEVLFNVS